MPEPQQPQQPQQPRRKKLDSEDIRAGIGMASEDFAAVKSELQEVARELRPQLLRGEERKEFLLTMSQDELMTLKTLAEQMGPRGIIAFESILREAESEATRQADSGMV